MRHPVLSWYICILCTGIIFSRNWTSGPSISCCQFVHNLQQFFCFFLQRTNILFHPLINLENEMTISISLEKNANTMYILSKKSIAFLFFLFYQSYFFRFDIQFNLHRFSLQKKWNDIVLLTMPGFGIFFIKQVLSTCIHFKYD